MRINKGIPPVILILLMALMLQGCAFLKPGIDDFKASSNIQRVLKVLQASKLIYDTTQAIYTSTVYEIGITPNPTPEDVERMNFLLSKDTKAKFDKYQAEHDRILNTLKGIKEKVDNEGFEFSLKDARAWQLSIAALTQYATSLAQDIGGLR